MVYKYALEHLPKSSCEDIFKAYTIHEKKYGDRTGIEDVITSKRKFQYEEVNFYFTKKKTDSFFNRLMFSFFLRN